MFRVMTHCRRIALGALALVAMVVGPEAGAQVAAVQGVYVPAGGGQRASRGVQAEVGVFVPAPFVEALASVAVEYQRQDDFGSGRGRVAAELRLLPRYDGRFVPYAGGSVSANQSGGDLSEWSGTLPGIEALAGLMLVLNERVPVVVMVEERFGYVREQSHFTATHVGLMFRFH